MTLPLSRGVVEELGVIQPPDAGPLRIFPRFSKLLHWLTAAMVLAMFVTGVTMKQLGDGPLADELYTVHKMAGVGLLALVLARLGYRAAMHLAGRWRQGAGSHVVHVALYAGLILVPLLGWAGISDYGARSVHFGLSLPLIWPEGAGYADMLFKAHAILAFGLIALVAVHIGIALNDYIQRGADRLQPENRSGPAKSTFPAAPDMP
jgi:cytochrome b561